jgi:hypothetical protein
MTDPLSGLLGQSTVQEFAAEIEVERLWEHDLRSGLLCRPKVGRIITAAAQRQHHLIEARIGANQAKQFGSVHNWHIVIDDDQPRQPFASCKAPFQVEHRRKAGTEHLKLKRIVTLLIAMACEQPVVRTVVNIEYVVDELVHALAGWLLASRAHGRILEKGLRCN